MMTAEVGWIAVGDRCGDRGRAQYIHVRVHRPGQPPRSVRSFVHPWTLRRSTPRAREAPSAFGVSHVRARTTSLPGSTMQTSRRSAAAYERGPRHVVQASTVGPIVHPHLPTPAQFPTPRFLRTTPVFSLPQILCLFMLIMHPAYSTRMRRFRFSPSSVTTSTMREAFGAHEVLFSCIIAAAGRGSGREVY